MTEPIISPLHPKPPWLRKRMPSAASVEAVRGMIGRNRLHTVCQEARCPNIWECYARQTATFLIMGDRCSRNCRFCAVGQGPLLPLDREEPKRIAAAVDRLNLDYAVITSVTRDDLPDFGASHFYQTILAVRNVRPQTRIEVLIPDMMGDIAAIHRILEAKPDVLNHNIETVSRLYPQVRPKASYSRSLTLLETVRKHSAGIPAKSGLMLGLGEEKDEILATLRDLHRAGCRVLTLGQYLQPTRAHLPVARYVPPLEFESWRDIAKDLGFAAVASGPFIRSSYQAKEVYHAAV